jgi:uncharacterized protein
MQNFAARYPVVSFIILNYFITFLFRMPLAASTAGVISVHVPRGFQFVGDFGPLLAALILTGMLEGGEGIKRLLKPAVQWKIPIHWYMVALLGTLVLLAVAAPISILGFDAPVPDLTLFGHWEELPYLSPLATWVFLLFTIGLGEEVGWRGFMLPRLQTQTSALTASVVIGIAWVFWHLPTFIFDPQFAGWSLLYRLGWGFLLICASIFYTWLYNSTRGNLLIPILFHGTNDFILGSLAFRDPMLNLIWAVLFIGVTVAILRGLAPQTLSAAGVAIVDNNAA